MSRRDHSIDPSNPPPGRDELRAIMGRILELPVSTVDGLVYQFTTTDELKMRKAQKGLSVNGGSIPWRQLNNDTTMLDGAGLRALIDELEMRQFQRGLVVDSEYMSFKSSGSYTRQQLKDWLTKYSNGFIP